MKRPYLLTKRGKNWYYRLAAEQTFHSTGKQSWAKAEAYVLDLVRRDREKPPSLVTLRDFASNFFTQEGDWVSRQHHRGRPFSSAMSRYWSTLNTNCTSSNGFGPRY